MTHQASTPTEAPNSGSSSTPVTRASHQAIGNNNNSSSNSAAPSSSSSQVVDSQASDLLVFACPHGCGVHIAVNKSDINCGIFRCGANTVTGVQLAPHATKQECDAASLEAGFVGCGRPFKFDGATAAVCGYI